MKVAELLRTTRLPSSGSRLPAGLPEVHSRSLEEAVFKVVQVPQNAAAVELCLRVAVGEVHAVGSGKLHGGQQTDGLAQQLFLILTEYAGLAAFLDGIE